MKNTKRSITFKVLAGYLLLTAFAAITVWFVYGKIINLSRANRQGNTNNEKLFLISEAVTNLYTAEGISRNIIQNQRPQDLPKFNAQIDTISVLVDSLKTMYEEGPTKRELDSINTLLDLKEENLMELLQFRKSNASNNYYDRVLNRLQEINYIFEDYVNEEELEDLEPYQRDVYLKILGYIKEDNAETLTQQSADSLINSMKKVLSELEIEEREYQQVISRKENELLEYDRNLSEQLRKLRSEIEQEEIQKSVAQVTESQSMIKETSEIIMILGIACMLTILLFVVLILKDTNSSQRYRQELEKAKLYAEFLLKRREQIMATVTHDLRSPLNTIVGYSDLLKKTSLTDKQSHYLMQLKKSSHYILRLVNDLLDFSKLESGKVQVEKLPFNPKNLINDSVLGVIPVENAKSLKVEVSVDESLNRQFLGDPFRIQQILTNLIGNAYKFTEKGSIQIKGTLDTSSIKGKKLKIAVIDSGIGISKEQEQVIFEEFSQAKASIEKQYGGSGLGLAITKKLVTLLGGSIELKSTLNKGSTFTVFIPVENAKHTYTSETTQQQLNVKNTAGKRILIVDDETTQLTLTSEVVKQAGFAFEIANNAFDAYKKARKASFDLILTDIQMPKMNGFQLLRKLKSNKKTVSIPVVALSGRTEISQEIYTEKGFKTNIIKPFDANELIEVMARILDLKIQKSSPKDNKQKEEEFHQNIYSLEDLKIFTGQDEASLVSIIKTFVGNTQENLTLLNNAANKKNLKQLAFTAHKMLPMFRQLKAHKVIGPLVKLEQPNESKINLNAIEPLLTEINQEAHILLEALQADMLFEKSDFSG